MSRIFAITSSSDRMTLDAVGRGRVSFTVTNTGREARTVRCRAVPVEPAQAAWFETLERPERRLQPGATEQLTVVLHPPTGAPAGSYSFRLDAVSVENPDEDFVAGPSVAFEVAPSEAPARAFPWWILVVAGVLLAAVVTWLAWPRGPAGLRESCRADEDCADQLLCDGRICLGGLQSTVCTDRYGDCATGLMCLEGTCEMDTTGLLCAIGCAAGQTCGNTDLRCARLNGETCSEARQCLSQVCGNGGICSGIVDGRSCLVDEECASGYCFTGLCQQQITCTADSDCPVLDFSPAFCAGGVCREPRLGIGINMEAIREAEAERAQVRDQLPRRRQEP